MYRAEYRYSRNHRLYEIDSEWETLPIYDEDTEQYNEWGTVQQVSNEVAKADEMMPGVYVYRMTHKPDGWTQ